MFITSLIVNLESDGTVRGVLADYSEIVDGRERPVGTRRIAASDIEQHLPNTASMLAQIADYQASIVNAEKERDEAVTARKAAEKERDEAKTAAAVTVPAAPDRAIHKAYLRAALASIDKLTDVDAAVRAAGPVKWELWANATTISQDDADVNAVASALKIDLPAVFAAAEAIRTARGE